MSLGVLVIIGIVMAATAGTPNGTWAGDSQASGPRQARGDVERGRTLFNGKGACYYCHGVDGNLSQPAQLTPEAAALIARLDPKPSDLRAPARLHLRTDKERFRAIREGHTGTAMFPDTTLTDHEISDLLAYLAALRGDVPKPRN